MQNALKSTESRRIWVAQFLKLKYKRANQISKLFCKIGSPQEIRSHRFNLRNFGKTEKAIDDHVKCIEIYSMTENLDP